MGKSTVVSFFRAAGISVWDADEAVHRLYSKNGAGVAAISAIYPAAIKDGEVDRQALKDWIKTDTAALKKIENAIHPLVSDDRAKFLKHATETGQDLVVFDIPLLFEIDAQKNLDAVLVVTAPPEVQRARVLARPGVTEEVFEMLLSKQMPDAEKRARADYIIESVEVDPTREAVQSLIKGIRSGGLDA